MVDKVLFSSRREDWGTPQGLYDALNREFHFNLDPAATKANAKCRKFYTPATNGLAQSWRRQRVFLNPPYGRGVIEPWVRKAATERTEVCVCLIHARTDTKWFQNWVLPWAHEIRFVSGRIRFEGAPGSSPFPSVIVVYRPGKRKSLVCQSYKWR